MSRRGFTLLELLLAIALTGALVASMFAFLRDLLSSRDKALDASAAQLAAATVIERIEADLMTCLVGDDVNGAGVEGDATRLSILSRGVPVHLAERGADDALADLQRTEYRFDGETGGIEAARREPGADGTAGADAGRIGSTVGRVRFRYHDSTAWRDSFDSLEAGALPLAVEIAVWLDPRPVDAVPGEALPQRLTFDASGGFDEAEAARRSDLETDREPRPDRIRVILGPDASPAEPKSEEAAPEPQEP